MMLRPSKMRLLSWLPDAVVVTRGPRRRRALFLTFDDGPDPQHTPALLDLLKAQDARASFFMIGCQIERHPGLVERMVAEGHCLGNHSYQHPQFHTLSLSEQLAEVARTDALLAHFDGRPHHGFRPPRGVFSLPLMLRFAADRRKLTYWSYDTLDYQRCPPADLVARLRREPPQPGEVLLMHDDSDCSLHMLETLLPEWKAAGFSLEALPV
jgi:peptidoglycan/xylan/chitin deacetylase (PgdA/CDA1 family)